MRLRALALGIALAAAMAGGSTCSARADAAADCLKEARKAAFRIDLTGDQSAALREIAIALSRADVQAALETVGGIRRPSDAARALAAVGLARAETDRAAAIQDVTTAGRLLLRTADPDRRATEQKLLLWELSALEEDALAAAQELPEQEAKAAVVLARAHAAPEAALRLFRRWELSGPSADEVLQALAVSLALTDPTRAVELASAVSSARARNRALCLVAERQPPSEALAIAQQADDPVARASIAAGAAARLASSDPDAALAVADRITVARDSAVAQVAAALAETSYRRALEVARSLPDRPQRWALGRIAVTLASYKPEEAAALLEELSHPTDVTRAALGEMARVAPEAAIAIARDLPAGPTRDAAMTSVARALPRARRRAVREMAWEISSEPLRARVVQHAALLSLDDVDAATSVIGLVAQETRAARIRAAVAARLAAEQPKAAQRLLESLPASDFAGEAALRACVAALAAGVEPKTAVSLASTQLDADAALRWAIPSLLESRARSPITLSREIARPYLQALALVDVARKDLRLDRQPRRVPERAQLVRPVVEWEGL